MATTTVQEAQARPPTVGERFTLGGFEVTVLSVQDPFTPPRQTAAQPGTRAVSVAFEAVSGSSTPPRPADLPTFELGDDTGATYKSEHGRIAVISGSPGQPAAGGRVEGTVQFEVPATATGLRLTLRSRAPSGDQTVTMALG